MREPVRGQESKKDLRAETINCSVGNRSARGQGRLVPGNAALILALKFGQGRQSLPRPIGRQGRLGIMYLCIYDPFWLKSAVHIDERIFSSVGMMIVPKQNRLNDDILEASECLGSWFLRKLGGEF